MSRLATSIKRDRQRDQASGSAAFLLSCTIFILLDCAMSIPASAIDKPPLSPDQAAPAVTQSSISATIEIGMRALDDALEQRVPKRLATFDDRMTECWHRRILGRDVDIDCVYSGYVERVGGIPLRAEDGRLVASTPLFGVVSAQGTGRFTRLLHGTAQGQMTMFASARPRLRPDWSVSLDMSEGFHWTEPPTLAILGFRINLARYVEPRIRSQLARVQADFESRVRAIGLRDKAAFAWQQAFASVKIVDAPAIWVQSIPQSVAFSGLRASGDLLDGSIELAGTTQTFFGSEPPAPTPTPLPALHDDVSQPGRFSIILPVRIGYDQIRDKLQSVLASRLQSSSMGLQDINVYPSGGKLAAGLRLSSTNSSAEPQWIYATATPQVDVSNRTIQLPDFAFVADPPPPEGLSLSSLLGDGTLQQALRDQVRFEFQSQLQGMIASANARLTRPLGNNFRSEGNLTAVALDKVLLLADGIRLDLRVSGDLKILYGL
jgi:hypothetical protein